MTKPIVISIEERNLIKADKYRANEMSHTRFEMTVATDVMSNGCGILNVSLIVKRLS